MKKINIYIFCSQKQVIQILDYFVKERRCYWNIISWHKTNPVPTCNNKYLPDTEYCLFFREQGVPLGGTVSTKSTYYLSPSNKRDKELYGHPTPKPLPLIEKFVKNSSREGDIILDPFMGSGTTAEAALKNGRLFVGVELNPEYVNIAQMRIKGISRQLTMI